MNTKVILFTVIIFGIFLRVVLAFGFEGTGDTGGWRLGSLTGLYEQNLGMGDGTIYDQSCTLQCANWPPLTYHYLIGMRWLYETLRIPHISDAGYYKLLSILIDTAVIYLIYILLKQQKNALALKLAALYAIHPIALYVSSYHGQRDIIWVFSLILSSLLLQRKYLTLGAITYAIGVSIKLPLIFFFPLLLLWNSNLRDRINFAVLTSVIIFVLWLPEIALYPAEIWQQVIGYEGWYSWWGLSGISNRILQVQKLEEFTHMAYLLQKYLLSGVVLFSTLYARRKFNDLLFQAFFVLTTLVVFIPSFSSQGLIWLLPFLVLYYAKYSRFTIAYSLTAIVAILAFYTVFSLRPLEILLTSLSRIGQEYIPGFVYPLDLTFPVWLVCVSLLVKMVRETKNSSTNKSTIGFKESRKSISHYIKWRQNRSASSIKKIKKHVDLSTATVVDVGCGYGPLCQLLANEAKQIIGTETDIKKLRVAKELLLKYKNVTLHRVKNEKLPLKTSSVDVIILFDVIEHVNDPTVMLSECYRCLKPNGLLYIEFTPYYNFVGHHLYDFTKWPIHILPKDWIKKYIFSKPVQGIFNHEYYWAQFESLNKMTISSFHTNISPFKVLDTHYIVKYPEVIEIDIPFLKYLGPFADFFTMSFEGFYKKVQKS